ncbi:hypothetical protein CSOJ01_08820 [Colletotrichum sojae]|uniref:Uncharacterized protein n=1 Tax=Colletotrichum sojae TaxID=2175907 RepID=A0A8H6J4T0_9PEZI|nr:hypothetical protein CSOJ01_08820 [Colletotrichum sojae]
MPRWRLQPVSLVGWALLSTVIKGTDQKPTGQQQLNAKQRGIHGTFSPSRRWGPDSSLNLAGRTSSSSQVKASSCRRRMQQEAGVASEVDDLKINAFCAIQQRDAVQGQSRSKDQAAEPLGVSALASRMGRGNPVAGEHPNSSLVCLANGAPELPSRKTLKGPRAPFSRLDAKIALATTVQLQPDFPNSFPAHSCEKKHDPFCDVVVGLIQIFPVELVARKPTSVVALSLRSASKLYQVKQTTDGIDEPIIRTQGAPKRTSAAAISHLIARGDPVGIPSQAEWTTQTQDVTRVTRLVFVATRSQQRTHLSTWRLDVVSPRGIGPGYASAFSLESESLSCLSPERHPARSFRFDERQDDTREWRTQEADKSACLQNRKTRPSHPWHPISSHLSGDVFHSINHGREPSRVTQRRFRFGQDRSCIDQLPAASGQRPAGL